MHFLNNSFEKILKGLATLLGGGPEEGQQQNAQDGDPSAETGADPSDQFRVILERTVKDAFAKQHRDIDDRTATYLQEIRAHLLEQGQRVASLEQQSSSKAGECPFSLKTDNKFQRFI